MTTRSPRFSQRKSLILVYYIRFPRKPKTPPNPLITSTSVKTRVYKFNLFLIAFSHRKKKVLSTRIFYNLQIKTLDYTRNSVLANEKYPNFLAIAFPK